MTPTSADLLDAAADAIERHGFVQEDLGDPSYGFCSLGALYFAATGDAHADVAEGPVRVALQNARRLLGHFVTNDESGAGFGIVDWNNTPGRTAEEVTTAMRHVATTLRLETE